MSKKPLVLLTGGSGMVGRNILEHPNSKYFKFIAPTSYELNLCDFNKVNSYLLKILPDIVVHAAGRVGGIQANINNPVNFLVENMDMGRNILLASRSVGIKRVLNLASSCIYPSNADSPLSEDLILKGELEATNEGYALSKIITLRLAQYINKENQEYQYKTLIPCNLFGRFDKFDPLQSHLIPAIIHKIHLAKYNSELSVEIWGDGNARREFMYASDLADAILKVILDFDNVPQIMNIGVGWDHTIFDYYKTIAKIIGWNGDFYFNLFKPVGMKRKLVDISLQNKWGWKSNTSLENAIIKTYNFYLENHK